IFHVLGKLPKLWSSTPARGRSYPPRPAVHARYERARRRQQHLYKVLFPSIGGGIRFQNEGSSKPRRQTLIPFRPYSYISGSLRRRVSVLCIQSSWCTP